MITLFTRKELYVTFSLKDKERITGILDAKGIAWQSRVSSRSGGLGGSEKIQ